MVPRAFALVAAVCLVAAGCSAPLDITKTSTLESGVTKTYDLDGQPKEQTVKVEVTSSAGEVNAYLVLGPKTKEFDNAGTAKAKAEIAAGSTLSTKSGSLSATVPPNTPARVYVELVGGGKTELTVKMTNRK